MATNNSSIGYSPFFHMPLIAGPAEGADPASHYAAIDATNTTLANFHPDNRITFSLSDQSHSTIYAMTGGRVRFYPPGSNLPDGSIEGSPAGFGTVGLEPWAADVGQLAQQTPDGVLPGSQPPAHILYSNIGATEFSNVMESYISEMSVPALRASWSGGGSAPFNRSPLEADFLGQVMTGDTFVFLTGGSAIGAAGPSSAMASDVQLDLAFVDTGTSLFSPQLLLTYLPSIGGAYWGGHPILASMSGSTIETNIHVRFEVYDTDSNSFLPIPQDTTVTLIDYDPIDNDPLDTEETNANGQVHFAIADIVNLAGDEPDLFFLVATNGQTVGGVTLPQEWSSDGWLATNSSPGYIKNFIGGTIGTLANPIVFRIGLDYHFQFKYKNPWGLFKPLPMGIELEVGAIGWNSGSLRTGPNGEVHGVMFNAIPGDWVRVKMKFNLDDPAINTGKITVMANQSSPAVWNSLVKNDSDYTYWKNWNISSIGTFASPEVLTLEEENKDVYVYFLHVAREWSEFLFLMTNGDWAGVDIEMYLTSLSGTSYSWPAGEVNIAPSDHKKRHFIAHELTHQIMWERLQLNITYQATLGSYTWEHNYNSIENPIHALIEGWAEFMELVFGSSSSAFPISLSPLSDGTSITSPPTNKGHSVEGAIANGLWNLFKEQVIQGASTRAYVVENDSGNILDEPYNSWIADPLVQARFQQLIWNPFVALAALSTPDAADFTDFIKASSLGNWHVNRLSFAHMNAAIDNVTVASLTPSTGSHTLGGSVTIAGSGFLPTHSEGASDVRTQVVFGGVASPNISVTSDSELNCFAPNTPSTGLVDVEVNIILNGTVARTISLPNAFEYI